jgi:hypothetical protein
MAFSACEQAGTIVALSEGVTASSSISGLPNFRKTMLSISKASIAEA